MFLPFDHRIGSTYRDTDEVSEIGGMDAEFGVSEPLFLAEKNVYYPSPREVASLETYVADSLFKYIQDPETYDVRASLYWKLRYPSSPWSHWTEKRTKDSYRAYNYAHVANIYHALYQVGKRYGLLTRKSPQAYLLMAYHTSVHMFRRDAIYECRAGHIEYPGVPVTANGSGVQAAYLFNGGCAKPTSGPVWFHMARWIRAVTTLVEAPTDGFTISGLSILMQRPSPETRESHRVCRAS